MQYMVELWVNKGSRYHFVYNFSDPSSLCALLGIHGVPSNDILDIIKVSVSTIFQFPVVSFISAYEGTVFPTCLWKIKRVTSIEAWLE